MPVIKSAKKQMRQNIKRRARNFPVRSELKTLMKKGLKYISDGKLKEAQEFLPKVFSIIDTACKKGLIHPNNADRKKSRVARALNALEKGGVKAVADAPKVEKKAEKPAPKAEKVEKPEVPEEAVAEEAAK